MLTGYRYRGRNDGMVGSNFGGVKGVVSLLRINRCTQTAEESVRGGGADDFRGFIMQGYREIPAVGTRIGGHFLFIKRLSYFQGFFSSVAETPVGELLQCC